MKALLKFAKEKSKEFDWKEAATQSGGALANAVNPALGSVAGAAKGWNDNHGVTGTLFGPAGAAGSKAKDTGESKLKETALGYGAAGSAVVASAGLHAPKGVRGKVALAGAGAGAGLGALTGATHYGLGHLFGEKQKKKKERKEK